MTTIATQLATKLVNETPSNLYLDVEHIDNDLIFITYRYKNESLQSVSLTDVMYRDKTKPTKVEKIKGELIARLATSSGQADKAKGSCNGSYVVEYVVVDPPGGGWGRLLYYVAMHFAKDKGLIADRIKSSGDAVATWNKLWNDPEINKTKQLDDVYDPKTPTRSDDCNLASSGVYNEKEDDKNLERKEYSRESHKWNPLLRGKKPDANEQDDEEYDKDPVAAKERADKYKLEKASKVNYTYIADSKEAINILSNAGRIAYDGKFPQKPSATLASVTARPDVPRPLEENHVFLYGILFGD